MRWPGEAEWSAAPPQGVAHLLRPLHYALRVDNIDVVRNLEAAVVAGLAKGRLPAEFKQRVEQLARGLDGLNADAKRGRVQALVDLIEGQSLPTAATSQTSGPVPPSSGVKKSRADGPAFAPRRSRKPSPPAASDPPAARPSEVRRFRGPLVSAPLETPVTEVPGIGPKTAERLTKKGIETLHDVLFFLPRGYQNRRSDKKIAELMAGDRVAVEGEVLSASIRPAGRGRRILEAIITDGTGRLVLRFFRFRNALLDRFAVGERVRVAGAVSRFGAIKQMVHPELDTGLELDGPQCVPVYPDIEGVPARTLRNLVQRVAAACAHRVEDPLPEPVREAHGLPGLSEALERAHAPGDGDGEEALERMRNRLVFDELLLLQLALGTTRQRREGEPGLAQLGASQAATELAADLLPFTLTDAQARVCSEIAADLEAPRPMSRLLLGDVGSGKTAVALLMAAAVQRCGRQTALLAPTEVLAEQHHRNARMFLETQGYRVAMLSGSTSARSRSALVRWLKTGHVDLVIGTHALLEPDIEFKDLGLVIIDEQHRFGVHQRKRLLDKRTTEAPDLLVMTATPIPRTLALTAYGDLQVSVIDEMPPGRKPPHTELFVGDRAPQAYRWVDEALAGGHQAFIVFPLVDASEKLDLKAATEAAEHLRERFAGHQVGLLHGRLKPEEKSAVMDRFKRNEIQVLVSTTVIEVGVDVPNATVMVIEEAERFGLSQLHQLRGRVGRGGHRGVCCLVSERGGAASAERLEVLVQTHNGFEVAERDLQIRGPGEMLGTRQSGLPDLALADLVRDAAVLEQARALASDLLSQDPDLGRPDHQSLKVELHRRFRHRLGLADVG